MPPSPSRSCRRAWGALLASALATAACRPDLALPSEAELSCRAGDRCPDGYVCNELVGRCVSTAGGDRRPPEVVAGSARVEPALAGRGRTVVVRFAVDEPLALPPQLRLATAAAPAWTSAEEREGTWASSYAPTGDEPTVPPAVEPAPRSKTKAKGKPKGRGKSKAKAKARTKTAKPVGNKAGRPASGPPPPLDEAPAPASTAAPRRPSSVGGRGSSSYTRTTRAAPAS